GATAGSSSAATGSTSASRATTRRGPRACAARCCGCRSRTARASGSRTTRRSPTSNQTGRSYSATPMSAAARRPRRIPMDRSPTSPASATRAVTSWVSCLTRNGARKPSLGGRTGIGSWPISPRLWQARLLPYIDRYRDGPFRETGPTPVALSDEPGRRCLRPGHPRQPQAGRRVRRPERRPPAPRQGAGQRVLRLPGVLRERALEDPPLLSDVPPIDRVKFRSDPKLYGLAQWYLQQAVELLFGTGAYLVMALALPKPEAYHDILDAIGTHGIIDKQLAYRLEHLANLRNLLAYDREQTDIDEVYTSVQTRVADLLAFADQIERFIGADA